MESPYNITTGFGDVKPSATAPSNPKLFTAKSRDINKTLQFPHAIKVEEPFPLYPSPAECLIAERCNVIDKLERRCSRQTGDAKRTLQLTSVVFRMTDSGHIKRGEDLTSTRGSASEALQAGQNQRRFLKNGNKRWPVSKRAQYRLQYVKQRDLDPRDMIKKQFKQRYAQGVRQARRYVEEFGVLFLDVPNGQPDLDESDRGQTTRRTNPRAFDRERVFTSLMMFRNSFPAMFEATLTQEIYEEQLAVARRKLKAARAVITAPAPSPATPPPSPPLESVSTSTNTTSKHLSTSTKTSRVSFSSFASVDTFGVGVKRLKSKILQVSAIAQKAASKIPGLCRFGTKKVLRGESAVAESSVVPDSFAQSERDLDAVQQKLDRVSQWMSEVSLQTCHASDAIATVEYAAVVRGPLKRRVAIRRSKDLIIRARTVVPPNSRVAELLGSASSCSPIPLIAELPCEESAQMLAVGRFGQSISQSEGTGSENKGAEEARSKKRRDGLRGRYIFGAR